MPALKASLARLDLDYVDLWLMHYPAVSPALDPRSLQANQGNEIGKIQALDIPYTETWTAMEECVDLGLARNIGVSSES